MGRTDVTITSGGEGLAAWLYEPDGAAGPVPCVVMAHGFIAVRDQRLDAYAERFCAAGMACLVFDYRHFGDSPGQPRQLLSIKRQHEDYRAVIAYARELDGIDPDRIALWGSSFSGGHVTALAAEGQPVAAVVAQAPFGDGLANLPSLGVGVVLKETVHGLRDLVGSVLGREPHYIPASGEPGTDAVLQMEGAEGGYAAITSPTSSWRNQVAARIALQIGLYRPATKAAQIPCPILYCVCDHDNVTPPGPILKAAVAAPKGELIRYGLGHWDIYLGEPFEQTIRDQTAFLQRHLGLHAPGSPTQNGRAEVAAG